MKRFLIITTINEPTKAVKLFSIKPSWQTVVVGDKKTPSNWCMDNVVYLSCEEQKKFGFVLPWNNYVRKMVGYIYAIKNGADVIAETDDDNAPYSDWGFGSDGIHECIIEEGFANVYKMFTSSHIWPRGYPLDKINDAKTLSGVLCDKQVGIWQGLADRDPDVDAIYRLTNKKFCFFNKRPPVVLKEGVVCPFNSQNTLFKKEMFPLLYLPVTVNQRFADILRGYVAQPVMWCAGYNLGFTQATVTQKRNPHNLLKDFEDELPCYMQSERAYQAVKCAVRWHAGIKQNMIYAYESLAKEQIVKRCELEYLHHWLQIIGE